MGRVVEKIREATKSDAKKIAEIYKEAYLERPYNEKWNERTLTKRIKDCFKECKILVAEVEKGVVGFIMLNTFNWDRGLNGIIEDFCVKKEFRGKGVGRNLLKAAESELRKRKVNEIWMRVHEKVRAFGFYKRKGYKESGFVLLIKKLK